MINKRLLICPLVAAAVCMPPGLAAAVDIDPARRCGRAVVLGSNRILRSDSQVLSRCLMAILSQAPSGDVEEACAKLRTPGLRLDRVDARARANIVDRCDRTMPQWLPDTCRGSGPARGSRLVEPDSVAHCAATASHCTALASLDMPVADPVGVLLAQHPGNLGHRFGGVEGNAFIDCLGDPPVTTTTVPTTVTSSTTTTSMTGDTTTTTLPAAGDLRLVITEIMPNPAAQTDSAGEYFEILNAGSASVDLAGLMVQDLGSDSFTIDESVIVEPGQYAVLGKSGTAAGGLVDHVYGSGMSLTNSSDEIVLISGGDVVDQVIYDAAFPVAAGRSMQVVAGAEDTQSNDAASSWCASDTVLADGDFGSPRSLAGACLP